MVSKRKLAAILFTDIVGYSAQISADETRSLKERLRVERLIKDCAATHNGRVIKTIGDAVMLEFGSAVDAVSCAITIQERMQSLNDETDSTPPVQVRIGVHVGDVVVEDNDLFGNAVNIAQRVQDMAAPGGICISREVYVQIRPILKLRCDVVTAPGRKPMPEPVEVLTISSDLFGAKPPRRRLTAKPAALILALLSPIIAIGAWICALPLWNLGEWGAAVSGILVGGILMAVLGFAMHNLVDARSHVVRVNGHWGKRIALISCAAVLFGFAGTITWFVYVRALDYFSVRGWQPESMPGAWAHASRVATIRLMSAVPAWRPAPADVSFEICGHGQPECDGRDIGAALALPSSAAFAAFAAAVFTAFASGYRPATMQSDGRSRTTSFFVSLWASTVICGSLAITWLHRDRDPRIELKNYYGAAATRVCRIDAESTDLRLHEWFAKSGYEVAAHDFYSIYAEPEIRLLERRLSTARGTRLLKSAGIFRFKGSRRVRLCFT